MIHIEGNIDDTWTSMRHLVERLAPLHKASPGHGAEIDLSKLRYLGPDGATIIAGSICLARERGIPVKVDRPVNAPQSLSAFLAFSGFDHMIFGEPLPDPSHPQNVTVPLRMFRQSRHDDPAPVIDLIARFEPPSEDLQFRIGVAIAECVQNIEDHSRSPIGGMACARFTKQPHEVRVTLADWGEGILASLKTRYPDTASDVHALQRVLFGGYSALSRRNNLGRGIDNLRTAVACAGGSFYIVSGCGVVDVQGNTAPVYHTIRHGFHGTIVCFTLPTVTTN